MASPLERTSTALGWGYAKPTCTKHSDHHLERCPTVRQKQGLRVSGFGTDGVEFLARDSENISTLPQTRGRMNTEWKMKGSSICQQGPCKNRKSLSIPCHPCFVQDELLEIMQPTPIPSPIPNRIPTKIEASVFSFVALYPPAPPSAWQKLRTT